MVLAVDTIAAIATPPGRGGVSVIRLSGPHVISIVTSILGRCPEPRYATYSQFKDHDDSVIDIGIALFFPGPNSFTGEDVVELQGHGGPVIMDRLLKRILSSGARLARPGEFSERAFLNDKIDLAQAEAIADLIDAGSEQAARSAMRSLQGDFSARIHELVERLIQLRLYVEAAIDFPEEEIDFLSDGKVAEDLQNVITDIEAVLAKAKQGSILREGITIVIAGHPNAGKSTLLNCLSGRDSAIVTDIPGTTRDVMREHIQIDGIPLHIIDTAGLRESTDIVEQEGIRRAWQAIQSADHVLLLSDGKNVEPSAPMVDATSIPVTHIINKIDLRHESPRIEQQGSETYLYLSAKQELGIDLLKNHLKKIAGYDNAHGDDNFLARRRHLTALQEALTALKNGQEQLATHRAGELLAEDCRLAQNHLSEITGEFTADDLLGRIFSSFCIGK